MTANTVAEVEASGGTAKGIAIDIRDGENVAAMVARVVQERGRVDVLVANAVRGRNRRRAAFLHTPASRVPGLETRGQPEHTLANRLRLSVMRPGPVPAAPGARTPGHGRK